EFFWERAAEGSTRRGSQEKRICADCAEFSTNWPIKGTDENNGGRFAAPGQGRRQVISLLSF
ncbi:MAG: hypothetical protein L6437_08250, partial [Kiritimatiellae bacterium]|nr:hypothetical protein [Kiritimatiellia bacterium]